MIKYNVYLDKYVAKDNYQNGITEHSTLIDCNNHIVHNAKTIDEAMQYAFEYLNIENENWKVMCQLFDDESQLHYTRLENYNYQCPSEEELKGWRNNEFDLFSAEYIFTIEEINTDVYEKIKEEMNK